MSGDKQVPSTYCAAPFYHIYSDNRGRYRLCCHASSLAKLKKYKTTESLPFEYLLSKEMDEVRESMLAGERLSACDYCYSIEDAGGASPRILAHKSNERAYKTVRDVELKLRVFGSHCNLGCYMCHPHNSSTRRQEMRSAKMDVEWPNVDLSGEFMTLAQHDRIVSNILENIELVRHIKLTGGEPLLLRRHYEFLEKIPDSHAREISLSYDTNLTHLSFGKWSLLDHVVPRFRSVRLAVSCDHFGRKLAWIRYPIDVTAFENNLRIAKPWINYLHCTVSLLNVDDLATIREYYENEFGIGVEMCSVVQQPEFLSVKNLLHKDAIREQLSNVSDAVLAELQKPADPNQLKYGIEYVRQLDAHRCLPAGNRAEDLWEWVA